ncbi:MAG TPA: ABC transporter permease subunit [Anaerolineales bacterium]|nr:ABC transporter permease subunit [Anaerolineales bacterium]
MRKVLVIMAKEWSEVFKNRFVLFTVAFLPLILTALPLIILGVMARSAEDVAGLSMADLPSGFADLCGPITGAECGQFFIVSQFMLLFMMMPLAIPVTIASYSIVGEKTTRTLEPLLATPIRTMELLAGKGLAAAIPAIGATWLGFAIFAVGVRLLAVGPGVLDRLFDPLWVLAIFVLGPLLALAAVSVAVMVSSRANDPRVAEQLSMLVILPLLGLFFGQVFGLVFLNEELILWMAVALAAIDAILIAFAIQLFQRETILTRWK